MCQLNWWLPICPFQPESSMAFHPHYWSCAVKNGSAEFNYYQWNADGRKNAAQHIRTELDPQVRIVCEPGGIIIFSAAQMHSTVPNTSGRTRFSLDFRTIHLDDAACMTGAANIDSAPTGTSLRDFMRASDLERVPNEVVRLYESEEPVAEAVVFRPVQGEGIRQ
jgi:ectoine hydroxylase-related dioxygenase (phytanoyl-CoA dioxygenase family)